MDPGSLLLVWGCICALALAATAVIVMAPT
jgi:hypothetical protein